MFVCNGHALSARFWYILILLKIRVLVVFTQAEAKPTRMLVLQLTDGSVEISAMEYHIIPSLSTESPPGVKVLYIC